MIEIPQMLNLEAAVAFLKPAGISVSKEYLRCRILDGQLKGRKLGRGWHVSETDLLAFANRTVEPPPPEPPREGRTSPRGHGHGLIAHYVNYAAVIDNMLKKSRKKQR